MVCIFSCVGLASGFDLPKATSVVAVMPAPPKPPFNPAFMKRSKFLLEKKSWFSSTNFSAAADETS
jgi:hypothetical protein